MATSTYLSNPASVKVGGVDLTDQCTAAVMTVVFDTLEETTFGSLARTYVKGLENNTCTLTLFNSYASAETYVTLLGFGTCVAVKQRQRASIVFQPFDVSACQTSKRGFF